jgi:hypothetical protein
VEKVRCPHCDADVEPPEGGGPFFCPGCHGVIDLQARRAGIAAAPDSPETAPPAPAPRDVVHVGPGHGVAAAQKPAIGYLLAALVAGGAAYGLARLSWSHFHLPIVYPALVGGLIAISLALGSGGGTPDRGVLGFLVLGAICLGTAVVTWWVDYDEARRRETKHWEVIFGTRGTETAQLFARRLRDRDRDRDDEVTLLEDGTTVSVEEETRRAERAVATGVKSRDSFDIPLLAATQGRKGFEGFLLHRAQEGKTLRVTPDHQGWRLSGDAVVALAVVELLTTALFAFPRRG